MWRRLGERSRAERLLVGIAAILVFGVAGAVPPSAVADTDIRTAAAAFANPITITVNGPVNEGSGASLTIEGAPPPAAGGQPPFGVLIRLNGWSITPPPLTWNPETQSWSGQFPVPPGTRGGSITIALTNPPCDPVIQTVPIT